MCITNYFLLSAVKAIHYTKGSFFHSSFHQPFNLEKQQSPGSFPGSFHCKVRKEIGVGIVDLLHFYNVS